MEILRVKKFEDGNIVFDLKIGKITIYGCKVIKGKNGEFIGFPNYKGKDAKHYNHVWIELDKDETKAIITQVKIKLV